jgi:hypothetical protein
MPFYGVIAIPGNLSPHDWCCMVKRFFRELQPPLFGDGKTQAQILAYAGTLDGRVRVNAILKLVDVLKPAHLGTLGFLMRQLKFVSWFLNVLYRNKFFCFN